ncbi:MAG: acetylxylan esterase [Prevotella sp.]|nr:acetylxylan esterase [Prevotella sp.]
MKTLKTLLSTIILVALPSIVGAQQPIYYDQWTAKIHTLPMPLICSDGTEVTTTAQWERLRRPELLRLFAEEEYGIFPTEKVKMKSRIVESSDDALGGIAKRRQIELTFSRKGIEHKALMLVYLPAAVEKAPMFMALNFNGNHTISAEDAEIISTNDAARGASESRWPLRKILSAGYGLATAHYYDFFPDDQLGCPQSIYRLFDGYEGWIRHGSQGGAIAAWSWGLSRMLDVLEKLPGADARRVAVMGHSRLGKTALWAGAQDERFAVVISNESGCGGAKLSRHLYMEVVGTINRTFPHWFCANFKKYNGDEYNMPFDQHELIALMAPRPVYVAVANDDHWCDPYGSYLSAVYARSVYELYGFSGPSSLSMPGPGESIHERIGFHNRPGKHDVKDVDWDNYIAFADKWMKENI